MNKNRKIISMSQVIKTKISANLMLSIPETVTKNERKDNSMVIVYQTTFGGN
jgi:hypothetical protein